MSGRNRFLLPLLLAGAALTGCQGNRELEIALVDYKNDVGYQVALLEKHNAFLKEKVAAVVEQVDELEQSNGNLSREVARYSRRPEEIRTEVIRDLEDRKDVIQEQQIDYLARLNRTLDDASDDLNERMDTASESMQQTLGAEEMFFNFVMGAQDSINQVFAARFDSRPWYESVLGKWVEKQPGN